MAETEGSAVLDAEDLLMLGLGSGIQGPSATSAAAADAAHVSDSHSVVSASAVPPDPTASWRKKKKKRKINRAGAAEAVKKKSKAAFKRDLPTGVKVTPYGKFLSQIRWGGKLRYIGSFDTPEQASAAVMSMRKDLNNTQLSADGADEITAAFDAAQKKAVEAVGGVFRKKKDLPKGVHKLPCGKFQSRFRWGGKMRYIGRFDTPEQASAAYMSARKDLDAVNLSAVGHDEVISAFDAAKKKALESYG